MKILYVILTCEKNKERQQWQQETWLNGIEDYIYLSKPIGEETYNNVPLKYIDFFADFDRPNKFFTLDHYDFLFFCDDDTFVYTDKLELLLKSHTGQGKFMIGFSGGTFPIYNLQIQWCSGGAGIALSREAVKNIQIHLRSTPRPLVTHETDISLAIWATMANKDLTVIDNRRFSPFNPHDAEEQKMIDCITYHYCTEADFVRLWRQL